MLSLMAAPAQGDQIVGIIGAAVRPELPVMDFEVQFVRIYRWSGAMAQYHA